MAVALGFVEDLDGFFFLDHLLHDPLAEEDDGSEHTSPTESETRVEPARARVLLLLFSDCLNMGPGGRCLRGRNRSGRTG